MIKASEDKVLHGNIDLIFENLLDIFKVTSHPNFASALKKELYRELDSSHYHRNCEIK